MPLHLFGRNKKLQRELEEQRALLHNQRLKELNLQDQLDRLEIDRQFHEQQLWARNREEERLKREREEIDLAMRLREEQRQHRLRETSPEALRRLRDLVRARYQLDTEIWSLKGARRPDRPIVLEKMEKADAVLMEIITIVETWGENHNAWTEQEWVLARAVKERVLADGKRWWENNPPWNDH
jgi:hypothetical protein